MRVNLDTLEQNEEEFEIIYNILTEVQHFIFLKFLRQYYVLNIANEVKLNTFGGLQMNIILPRGTLIRMPPKMSARWKNYLTFQK